MAIESIAQIARAGGYDFEPSRWIEGAVEDSLDELSDAPSTTQLKPGIKIDLSQSDTRNAIEPRFWKTTQFDSNLEQHQRKIREAINTTAPLKWEHAPKEPPQSQPLMSWNQLEPRLRKAFESQKRGNKINLPEIVEVVSKGNFLTSIPRQASKTASDQTTLVADRSDRLVPYWEDQDHASQALVDRFLIKPPRICIGTGPGNLYSEELDSPANLDTFEFDQTVLVLGDLGLLQKSDSERQTSWLAWLKSLNQRGCRVIALVPFSIKQIPQAFLKWVTPVCWQPSVNAWVREKNARSYLIRQIFQYLATAIRIEPGLLRDIRLLISEDASLESEFWQHWAVSSPSSDATSVDTEFSKDSVEKFHMDSLAEQSIRLIKKWRQPFKENPFVWFEELNRLSESNRRKLVAADVVSQAEFDEASNGMRVLLQRHQQDTNIDGYVKRLVERMPESQKSDVQFGAVVTELFRCAEGVSDFETETYSIAQQADRFCASKDRTAPAGSPLARISTLTRSLNVTGYPETETLIKPDWATGIGRDRFGIYADFEIEGDGGQIVRQRMRWIPPGEFMMGSPDEEEGRFDNEGPQRSETITEGFWLFDTPVTQELWQAIMGKNPSQFQSPRRPVESVSWRDAQKFLKQISQINPGLNLTLPTEAQWEYACRAGTTTSTYAGELEIPGDNNAPMLDAIAWYGGNSGHEFDLADGYDSSDWPEKQYDHKLAGTREVGLKKTNAWGLFDMLGNVWEWCQDSGDENESKSKKVVSRVLRGGSWVHYARCVRSASRNWNEPDHRSDRIGFRCLSVQSNQAQRGEMRRRSDAEQRSREWSLSEAQKFETQNQESELAVKTGHSASDPSFDFADLTRIRIQSDVETVELEQITCPHWASAIGRDRYGLWTEFQIEGNESSVTQRLRWIPPGRFTMGSPDSEKGRYENEGPQQEVIFNQGYWIFDTPVTQEMWRTVHKNHKNRFTGSQRPLESFNWSSSIFLISLLSKKLRGLTLRLPTESEWEYACRAGSHTTWFFGKDSDQLGEFAWVKSNSERKTHPVKTKLPNPWGLYDIYGNVWEWCDDAWSRSYANKERRKTQSKTKARVLRGGSYENEIRDVRSACRYSKPESFTHSYVGFRCVADETQVAAKA